MSVGPGAPSQGKTLLLQRVQSSLCQNLMPDTTIVELDSFLPQPLISDMERDFTGPDPSEGHTETPLHSKLHLTLRWPHVPYKPDCLSLLGEAIRGKMQSKYRAV